MHSRRTSANWLSDDMARALAAMCPPLQTTDVLRAADTLGQEAAWPDVAIVDSLQRADLDRVSLRNVIEALQALHDLRKGSW
jgi:hypothetical protein